MTPCDLPKFPLCIGRITRVLGNIAESGIKHHKPTDFGYSSSLIRQT